MAGARLKPGDTLYVHEGVYPIKDIEWILDDDSATVLIFGVTAE